MSLRNLSSIPYGPQLGPGWAPVGNAPWVKNSPPPPVAHADIEVDDRVIPALSKWGLGLIPGWCWVHQGFTKRGKVILGFDPLLSCHPLHLTDTITQD